MPVDELRPAVQALMGRAKDDLAELVAFKSVADPKQYPPEECEKAAQWVVDAFAEVGLQDVTVSPTPDGSNCVHGHAPGPEGAPTVLLYSHYDVQPPLGEDAVDGADLGADRARRPLVRARLGRLQGQHRHAPHRAARAARRPTAAASRAASSSSARAPRSRARAGSRSSCPTNADLLRADTILVVDTGNFAVGVPTLTTTLRGMTSVDVKLEALGSAMHSGMFGGPAPDALRRADPDARHAARRARQHDDRRARRDPEVDRRRLLGRAVPRDANVLDGVELMGDGTPADLLWARPSATVIGIDVPHVIGSSAAVQASAAARVSLRLPPGVTGQEAQDALVAHLSRACRGGCTARSSASRWATRSSARSTGPASSR